MLSMSNTAVASGYGPILGGSPVTMRRLRMPAAAAPSRSREHAEQVAVAAGVVHHRLHPDLPLDHEAPRQRAHPALGPGPVGNVDRVDARLLEQADLLEHRRRIHPLRRHDLDRGDESALRELGAEPGSLRTAGPALDLHAPEAVPPSRREWCRGDTLVHEPDDRRGCGPASSRSSRRRTGRRLRRFAGRSSPCTRARPCRSSGHPPRAGGRRWAGPRAGR